MKTGQISIMDAHVIQAKQHRPNQGAAGESIQATEAGYNVKQSSDGKQTITATKPTSMSKKMALLAKPSPRLAWSMTHQVLRHGLQGEAPAVTADSADASEAHHT